jgi:hypothetical protein
MTVAYVYKWSNKTTGKWYIGSRTAKNCHPDDGYICSSRKLKPIIIESKDDWIREILCIGEPEDMLTLEAKYLSVLDAKHDPLSYNMHNGDGKFTTKGVEPWNKGGGHPTGKPAWNSGKTCPQISAAKVGKAPPNKGKPSPRRGLSNPSVATARKSLVKDVTRIFDRRPMSMVYYNQWLDKIENPEKWADINRQRSEKMKGMPSHRKGKIVGPYKKKGA